MKRLLFRLLRKLRTLLSLNRRIRSSHWYYNTFPHLEEYESIQRNSDILCIGSTPAKFSIDFKNIENIKGSNLATLPETIYYDFQVIKNYHSYLKKNGVLLFVLCPFTFLKDKYIREDNNSNYQNIRYYPVLHRALIDNFNYSLFDKWVAHPYKIGFKAWVRAILDTPKSKAMLVATNPLSEKEMEANAKERIKCWMDEFGLKNLEPNSREFQKLQQAIVDNIAIYRDMISFAKERQYKCVVMIPPFSKELTALLPKTFVEVSLINPLKELGTYTISYFGLQEWSRNELFRDSFTLNATGRNNLTKDVIEKLKIEKIL